MSSIRDNQYFRVLEGQFFKKEKRKAQASSLTDKLSSLVIPNRYTLKVLGALSRVLFKSVHIYPY